MTPAVRKSAITAAPRPSNSDALPANPDARQRLALSVVSRSRARLSSGSRRLYSRARARTRVFVDEASDLDSPLTFILEHSPCAIGYPPTSGPFAICHWLSAIRPPSLDQSDGG